MRSLSLLPILVLLALLPLAAQAQCVGPGGINTVGTCPAAVSPVGSDVGLFYQPAQTPHTRKMSLAQIAAYISGQFPTKTEVNCGGVDDTTLIQGVFTTLAASGGQAIVHGHCVLTAAITKTLTVPAALVGDGAEVTTFTFTGATDGFSIMLSRVATNQWGAFAAKGFSVVRSPTSPAIANTAFKVYADPSAATAYYGAAGVSFSDITIRGNFVNTASWQNGMVLSGLVNTPMRNMNIVGVLTNGTDRGDVGLTLDGPASTMFGVSYDLSDSFITGYSTGLSVTGWVQGVFASNDAIIADYYGIRWNGVTPAINHTTNALTASGTTLSFPAGSLGTVVVGDFVSGTNIYLNTTVASVNNSTGQVVLANAVTGPVSAGATIAFQHYGVAEELAVTNSTFNASYRGIYAGFGGFHSVISSTILRWDALASDWSGIEFYETTGFAIGPANTYHGNGTGAEHMIKINSGAADNYYPAIVMGNNGNGINGSGILLAGTVKGTTVEGNSCYSCASVVDNSANPFNNTVGINTLNGVGNLWFDGFGSLRSPGFTIIGLDASTSSVLEINAVAGGSKNLSFNSTTALADWIIGVGGARGGGNTGDDMTVCRYTDLGVVIDCPLTMARSTGKATFIHDVDTSAGITTVSNVAFALPPLVSGLPTCNAGTAYTMRAVSDALAPAYGAAVVGGGAVKLPVWCDGISWKAH
jgi:hypothetical protein